MNGRSFYPPGRTKRVELPESPVRGRGLTWLASPTGPRTRSASPMGSPLASSSTLRASPIASKSSAMMRARAAADAGGAMDSKTSLLVPSALGRADRLGANRAQMGMDRSPGEVERAKKVAIAEQKAVLVEREIAKKKRRNRSRFRPVACFRFVATFAQAVTGLGGDRAWALINPTSRIVAQSLVMQPKDIYRFRALFQRIDLDGSGTIDFEEVFEAVDETRTPFTDFLFTLSADPGSHIIQIPVDEQLEFAERTGKPSLRVRGRLDFDDFFQVCAIYCSYTKEEVLQFAFNSFDTNGNRKIDELEYKHLCEVVNNFDPMFSANFQKALVQFSWAHTGELSLNDFKKLNVQFPMLLFPAFRLQDNLQSGTLGKGRWVALAEDMKKRAELDAFRQAHSGHLPDLPFWSRVRHCGGDPRWKKFGFDPPRDAHLEQSDAPPARSPRPSNAAVAPEL